MNLVVLADDAFTFLVVVGVHVARSWALVMAHHRVARQRARRLHLSGHGELRHAGAAARLRPARRPRRRLRLRGDARRASVRDARRAGAGPGADRRRLQGRSGAAACLAAARASGGAEPRLGADERRHDQGRGLRLRAHRLRPARRAGLVVEHRGAGARRHHRGDGRALRADAARPQAAARLSHGREHRHHLHRARPRARLQGARHGAGGGAGADRGAAPRVQPFAVQEPAVLRRRRGAHRDRRARHGAARRPHPPHAADRLRVPGRLRRDLGAAAAQRLRLGMADVPGDPAEPAAAVLGAEVRSCRRSARCWRCRRRSRRPASSRRSASRSSAAPRTPRGRARRSETDRFSLAAMFVLAALCLVAGILPGFVHRCARAGGRRAWSATRMPVQTGVDWLSIVPIAESRSSYNGLLVFLFMVDLRHRSRPRRSTASPRDRLRRAPAWDCGFPDPSPATQYTAGSFAQPIRRVFGTVVFRAREHVEMPPPGDTRAGALHGRAARSRSGTRSTRRSPAASASRPTGSTICSS